MTTKEKIIKYLDTKGVSKRDFYRQTQFSNGFLDSGEHIGSNNLKIIVDTYPDLSLDWLVLDKGEMIKNVNLNLEQNQGRNVKGNVKGNVKPNYENIPITDITVAAGDGAINQDNIDFLDHIQLPASMVKKGLHLCVRIKGDSMAPTLLDGGYCIIRHLDKSEWKKQKDEHIFAITTREGYTYLKRLKFRLSQGFVVCKSDNPDRANYSSFNIMENDILNIWYAEWYFTAKMPNIHDQYYSRLQQLEDDVELMKEKFNRLNR